MPYITLADHQMKSTEKQTRSQGLLYIENRTTQKLLDKAAKILQESWSIRSGDTGYILSEYGRYRGVRLYFSLPHKKFMSVN